MIIAAILRDMIVEQQHPHSASARISGSTDGCDSIPSPSMQRRAPLRIALVTETFPPEVNGVAMTLGGYHEDYWTRATNYKSYDQSCLTIIKMAVRLRAVRLMNGCVQLGNYLTTLKCVLAFRRARYFVRSGANNALMLFTSRLKAPWDSVPLKQLGA